MKHVLSDYRNPTVFQDSPNHLWTDPHIAKQMLAAHLNPEVEGATRQHSFVRASVEWIQAMFPASRYHQLLDLGCGPGIYGELFAAAGYQVTGVDISSTAIDYGKRSAQAAGLSIQYQQLDYATEGLPGDKDLVTLIYCDYGVLPPKTRAALLKKIYHSLRVGGVLLLDVFTKQKYRDFQETTQWWVAENDFWSDQPSLHLQRQACFDTAVFLDYHVVLTEKEKKIFYIWEQVFSATEIQQELQAAGFTVAAIYDDISGAANHPDSETLCIVAKK